MNKDISFFGDKVTNMILNAQDIADKLNFKHKVEDTIEDLLTVIGIAFDSVIASCENNTIDDIESDHFSSPELKTEPENISIDDLIAESYTYGKSDEQISKEFRTDLNDTVKNFAWLLVSIGIALDNEDKRDIVKFLKQKTIELKETERKLALNRYNTKENLNVQDSQ